MQSKKHRRREIWNKTPNGICAHCGRIVGSAMQTIDHFIPISMGGTNDKFNLMPLCKTCNVDRRTETIDPGEYYRFAYPWAIKQCCIYKKQWLSAHRDSDGRVLWAHKSR